MPFTNEIEFDEPGGRRRNEGTFYDAKSIQFDPEPKAASEPTFTERLQRHPFFAIPRAAGEGIRSAFLQAPEAIGSIVEYGGKLVGSDTVEDLGRQARKYWGEKVERTGEGVPQNFTDIKSASDFGKWAAYSVGNMAGQVATTAPFMLTGAGEAAVAGKAVEGASKAARLGKWLVDWAKMKPMDIPIGVLEAGEVAKGQLKGIEEGKDTELHPLRALAGAFVATKLEELGVERGLAKYLKFGPDVEGFIAKPLGKRIIQAAATGALGEGAEEFFQSYAEQFGIDPKDLATKQQFIDSVNAAAAGAMGGLFMGAGGGAMARKGAKVLGPKGEETAGTTEPAIGPFSQEHLAGIREHPDVAVPLIQQGLANGSLSIDDVSKVRDHFAVQDPEVAARLNTLFDQPGTAESTIPAVNPIFVRTIGDSVANGTLTVQQALIQSKRQQIDLTETHRAVATALESRLEQKEDMTKLLSGVSKANRQGILAVLETRKANLQKLNGDEKAQGRLAKVNRLLEVFYGREGEGRVDGEIGKGQEFGRALQKPGAGGKTAGAGRVFQTQEGQEVTEAAPGIEEAGQSEAIIQPGEQASSPPASVPITPKVNLPEGWKAEIGRTRTKEGKTAEAEVDWRGKRIVFSGQEHLDNPDIWNHEVAHVLVESLPDRSSLLSDYIKAKESEWKAGGHDPDWIVKNHYHREEIAMDYGNYLSNPESVDPGLRNLFEKHLGEARPVSKAAEITAAAHEAATSPLNATPEPTQGQIEAGNYKKGHVQVHGLDVSIENPIGSERKGVSREGKEWKTTMLDHYGYIRGYIGKDKDHIDVFIGQKPESENVYVVNQADPKTGKFDENKVMMGYETEEEARQAYLRNYEPGWKGLGSIVPMSLDQFKEWLDSGAAKKGPATVPRQPKPAKPKSLLLLVRERGGISRDALDRAGRDIKGEFIEHGLLGAFQGSDRQKGKYGLDVLYQKLSEEGLIPQVPEGWKGDDWLLHLLQEERRGKAATVEAIEKAADHAIIELEEKYGKEVVDGRREEIEGSITEEVSHLSDSQIEHLAEDPDFINEEDFLANPEKYLEEESTKQFPAWMKGEVVQFEERQGGKTITGVVARDHWGDKSISGNIEIKADDDRFFIPPDRVHKTPYTPRRAGSTAGGELFDTASSFSLSGTQPVPQSTFKPPEKKGERLIESERQDVDELADRLSGKRAKEEHEVERNKPQSASSPAAFSYHGTVYGRNYNHLSKLFEKWGLGALEDFKGHAKLKSKSKAIMDFNVEYLRDDSDGNPILAVSHYYEQNGDLVPDPDMEIRVLRGGGIEALTFQDYRSYQEVYSGGTVNQKLKKDLNSFLETWLKNIEAQGHEMPKAASPSITIASWVKGQLEAGNAFTKHDLFNQAAEAYGGSMAEGKFQGKDAFDAMEMGINQYIAERQADTVSVFSPYGADVKTAKLMVDEIRKAIMDKIPTQQGLRSEEQDEFQQFSTPPDLAYVMAWTAHIDEKDTVAEPSAGIGGLAVFGAMHAKKTIVNELSKRRAGLLRQMGFGEVLTENAEQLHNIKGKTLHPTVILMNPPFTSTAGRIKGQRKSANVVIHLDQALKLLQPGGRMVALIGKGWYDDPKALADYIRELKDKYNLRAIITVAGKGYAKYGTTYDNRILVVDKTAPEQGRTLEAFVEDVKGAISLLKEVRDARAPITQREQAESEGQGVSPSEEAAGEPGVPVLPATGDVGNREGAPSGRVSGGGQHQGHAAGRSGPDNEGAGRSEPQRPDGTYRPDLWPEGSRRPGVGGTRSASGSLGADVGAEQGADQGLTVERKETERATEQLSDSVYETYTPQKVKILEAKPHPGKLVESAAMAVVEPPEPTYSPKLPDASIREGKFSLAQLESVVYAGQAHQEMLATPALDDEGRPTGKFYRKGFFIGDGTGTGKGREIVGILRDNWNRGRKKAIWISQNAPLISDAKRDMKLSGWDPGLVHDTSKTKLSVPLAASEGIYFLGYDLLRSKDNKGKSGASRLDQLVNWFGKDYDGVIVFDEAHNMGNAIAVKGKRGRSKPSQKAIAGVELQRLLPNARVVYVSATGATEVMNLSYADRLGLWGEGTCFASKHAFIAQINAGGIAAMEFVARDMKALGNYLSRSLSYEDVKYERLEHALSPEQRAIYNELAGAWQMAFTDFRDAMDKTGSGHDGRFASAAMTSFYGAELRFFNQIITSMQTPAVVKAIEKDIENGHAVVLQVVDTNEAAQNRAIARMEEDEDLESLDMTPREQLMEFVRNNFPVLAYQEQTDPDDPEKTVWVPVKDSEGNNVENPEAVEMREALLEKLGSIRVPEGPLEMILNHFGHENVAEITGRTRRVITVEDETGRHKVIEKRSQTKCTADADAFMADKKRILIFSYAGGTGRSYHADLEAKNQRLRRHYLLQAGWRADRAIQGFGRSHRTNQKQAPEYVLVTTDVIGQKRFISSIARRLDQLGALTRGQREVGSGGFFTARDNLESTYAQDAITRLVTDIYFDRVPGWTINEFMRQSGLHRLVNEDDGSLNVDEIPPVTQFLNRLLAMSLETQTDIFEHFSDRMDQNIRRAMELGTLDVGLETLRAKRIRKISEQVVHTDERSGAQTKYVQLDVTRDANYTPFSQIPLSWTGKGFFRNIKSGQVWAANAGKTETDAETGGLSTVHKLRGPKNTSHDVTKEELENAEKYQPLSKKSAEKLWTEEYEALPKEITYQEHLVTGALLPIWDRLSGKARIMRVQTEDGERMIGRLIDPRVLTDTLLRLGATAEQASYTPQEIFEKVKDQNFTMELANGWNIKRAKVAGEYRIEVTGPDYQYLDELKRQGVFTERVDYTTRFFIPSSKEGVEVIGAITATRPVVNAVAPLGARENLGTGGNVKFRLTIPSDADALNKPFADRLDKYLAGGMGRRVAVKVTDTPAILERLGAKRLPVVITDNVIEKVLHDKHLIAVDTLKRIPAHIHDPIAVFDSATEPGSFVVMTAMKDRSNGTIVVIIHPSGRMGRYEVNSIASVYGKERSMWFQEQIDRGRLRYINNKKASNWFMTGEQLRLPTVRGTNQGSKRSILTEEDFVKQPIKFKGDIRSLVLGMHVPDVKKVVYKLAGQWKNRPRIEVISDVSELPLGYLQRDLKGDERYQTEGIFDPEGNVIYIIASAMHNEQHVVRTILHEAVGHFGLTGVIGRQGMRPILQRVIAAYGREGLEPIAQAYGLNLALMDDLLTAAEEKLAMMAETAERPKLFEQLCAMIRNALRKIGFELDFNEADWKALFEQARRYLESEGAPRARTAAEGNLFKGQPLFRQGSFASRFRWWEYAPTIVHPVGYAGTGDLGGAEKWRRIPGHDRGNRLIPVTREEAETLLNITLEVSPGHWQSVVVHYPVRGPQHETGLEGFYIYDTEAPVHTEDKEGRDVFDAVRADAPNRKGAKGKERIEEGLSDYFRTRDSSQVKFRRTTADDFLQQLSDTIARAKAEKDPDIGTPPPEPGDPARTKSWLEQQWSAMFNTIARQSRSGDLGKLAKILQSPEYWDHPVLSRIVRIFVRDRSELYHELFWNLDNPTGDRAVTEATRELRKTDPKGYQDLLWAIDYGDTRWKRDKRESLEDQVTAYENYLRSRGIAENVIGVWKLHRAAYDRALDLMTAQMRALIEEMTEKNNGMPLTKEEMSTLEQLQLALASMEQWRGFYAPRMREPGSWAVRASRLRPDRLVRRTFSFDADSTENEGRFEIRSKTLFSDYITATPETAGNFGLPSEEGINYILGKSRETGKYEVQAIRFKKSAFDEQKAAKWWTANREAFDPEYEFYRAHGSKWAMNRKAEQLMAEGWKVKPAEEIKRLSEAEYQNLSTVDMASAIDHALASLKEGQKGQEGAALAQAFNEEILELVSNMIKARGYRSTMIHRGTGAEVVKGYIEDPQERFVRYISAVSGGLSKAESARRAMQELLGEYVDGKKVGGISATEEPRAYETAKEYIKEQLRNTETVDRAIGIAKSIASFKYLGFNPRSVAVNLTAVVTTAPAAIHQYALGGRDGFSSIMASLTAAGKDYARFMAGKTLNVEDQAICELIKKEGWDDAQYVRDAQGELQKAHHQMWSRAMDAAMWMFSRSEQWNRGTTVLAAYRLARRQGKGREQALELAKTASDHAHGVYGKATLPSWASGTHPAARIGSAMYVYSKFGHNYAQMLVELGFKKHNIMALTWALAAPIALAGASAWPFKDELLWIINGILGFFGIKTHVEKAVWDSIRRNLGTTAERAGRHGLAGLAGVDISSSLSVGVGVPTGFMDLAGAIGGVGQDVAKAGHYLSTGQVGRAAEKVLPRAAENVMRAFREMDTGVVTEKGRRVWDENGTPLMPDAGQTAGRAFGFRSAQQAVLSERAEERHEVEERFADARNDIYEMARAYISKPDRPEKDLDRIRAEILSYNRQVIETGQGGIAPIITSESLARQARAMLRPNRREMRSIMQE